jgi:type III pantothenate kinase
MAPGDDFLAFDIGNSAIKGGLFKGLILVETFRLDAPSGAETAAELHRSLERHLRTQRPGRVGIASVVPERTLEVVSLTQSVIGVIPQQVHHTLALPFTMAYETPATLGADRLAAAAAAWLQHGAGPGGAPRHVVAIDAGTACTMDVVTRDGSYLGGSIAPGPSLLRRALQSGTAQLPEIPLDLPPTPIGRSTRACLQAGILLGFIDAVAGMLVRIAATLDQPPFVVATGGWSDLLVQNVPIIDDRDPHLVLRGIHALLAARKEAQQV